MKLSKYYNTEFRGDNQQPVVSIANKLWVANNFKILDSYTSATGGNAVDSFDKSDGHKAANIVNQWVGQSTNDMIKKLVTGQMMSDSE